MAGRIEIGEFRITSRCYFKVRRQEKGSNHSQLESIQLRNKVRTQQRNCVTATCVTVSLPRTTGYYTDSVECNFIKRAKDESFKWLRVSQCMVLPFTVNTHPLYTEHTVTVGTYIYGLPLDNLQ